MKNLTYIDPEHLTIRAELPDGAFLAFEEFSDHSLWKRAIDGEFGSITAYQPIQEPDMSPVSRLQAKAALLQMGLLDDVEYMVTLASPLVKLAWHEATEFRPDSPMLNQLAANLKFPDGSDFTEAHMAELFAYARSFQA